MTAPPLPREVSRAYDAFPASIGKRLLWVRELIFAAAAAHEGIGRLTETLKWGEPAYLTEETGSGSTIRLGRLKDSAHAAILFNCKTTLVDTFRERFPDQFEYRQTRALLLPVSGKLPKQDLSVCLVSSGSTEEALAAREDVSAAKPSVRRRTSSRVWRWRCPRNCRRTGPASDRRQNPWRSRTAA